MHLKYLLLFLLLSSLNIFSQENINPIFTTAQIDTIVNGIEAGIVDNGTIEVVEDDKSKANGAFSYTVYYQVEKPGIILKGIYDETIYYEEELTKGFKGEFYYNNGKVFFVRITDIKIKGTVVTEVITEIDTTEKIDQKTKALFTFNIEDWIFLKNEDFLLY